MAAHRPAVSQSDGIDWSRVDGFRQAFYGLGEQFVLPASPTPEHLARAEVLRRYWAADMAGMVAAWEGAGYEPLFPNETAILALGYAHLGDDRARALTTKLRAWQPIEADAIDAYLAARQGKAREAGGLLERVFVQLRTNPWGLTHAVELCFQTALETAHADPSFAPRLHRAVSEPFVVYAYEETRQSTMLAIAELVGPRELLTAVEAYEPHIPWTEAFLETRLRAYEAAGHPLARRARADLDTFRRQE